MGKIYTSRYSNKNLAKANAIMLGITLGRPRFKLCFELSGNIKEFAPPGYIFGIEDKNIFERKYLEHLDRLGAKAALNILERHGLKDNDLVLLCFEDVTKEGEWCHRRMLADWLEKNVTGYKVEEYPDDNTYSKAAQRKIKEKRKAYLCDGIEGQLTLF